MKTKETLKYAAIVLDDEKDFLISNLQEVFKKIEEYKKLPFHEVILQMNSKYYVKFLEMLMAKQLNYKEAEIKNNTFLIKF